MTDEIDSSVRVGMEIMICGTCVRPFHFAAVSTGAHHFQQPEPVPCPYGPHVAGERMSLSWWQSFAMSPEEQTAWLAEARIPGRDY